MNEKAAPEVLLPLGALHVNSAPQEPIEREQQKEEQNSFPPAVSLLHPQLVKVDIGPAGQGELSVSQARQ